jgi:hypothetical protein
MTEKIAKLEATVSTGNGIETLQIRINVNAAASATLGLGPKDTGKVVLRPLTSDVLTNIRTAQDERLAGVTEPNVDLTVVDGVYGEFKMSGFKAAPMLEISTASMGEQLAILDKVSMLDGLDLSIYQAAIAGLRADERSDGIPRPQGGDVAGLLTALTDMLVGQFNNALLAETDPVKREIMQMRHDLNNSGPLKIWKQILSESDVNYESWGALTALSDSAGRSLSLKTINMLTTKSSGFWNILNSLMAAFQMYYRPEPQGAGYGKLMLNKSKIDEVEGEQEFDILNLNVRDGSARILQVGGVIMEMGSSKGYRADERKPTTPAVAGVFPNPIKKGYIHEESAPIWLVDAIGAPILGSVKDEKKDVTPGSEPPNLKITEYVERKAGGKQHIKEFEKARSDVMTELCESMFKELQLADSSMSIKIPLNLTVEVGKRKTIKLGDAGSVEGFISAIVHQIDLREGKDLDSFSQVTVTHVKY